MAVTHPEDGAHPDHEAAAATDHKAPTEGGPFADYNAASDSDNLSLEARNEKMVQANPDQVTESAQLGVQKAEAAAVVWSKKALILTYAWIWVSFFVLALQSQVLSQATQAAYADFAQAPAVFTAGILANVVGGVLKLPIAKTLNLWGRTEGLLVAFSFYIIGMIILAACKGPSGYAAGYVIYYIGYDSVYMIMQIYIADTSGLRNRAFAFGFTSLPFICTAFTGPRAAQAFLTHSTWRWAIGSWCIITPCVIVPLSLIFKYYQLKAEKMGLFVNKASERTFGQSIVHYLHEFDVVGALILMTGFVLFLLPFSLVTAGRATYDSATFIAMVIIGFLLFFVFAAWEKWFARTHFIRYELFRERTVVGACCLSAISFFAFYTWDANFYNFCLVVYNLSFANAGYMLQIYNIGSTFWGPIFGLWVRYTKHFKYAVLFFGVPMSMLGSGLMIYFRGQDANIGYIVMCQIFIAFGGGTNVIGEDMAVMAASDREGVPMMLALLGLFSSIGGAIGEAVAAAIYNDTFPRALRERLPADADWLTIYQGGYALQMTYPVGSPTRDAINYAWGYSQKFGAVASLSLLVLAIPSVAVWKNYRVDKRQNKGTML